MVIFLVVVTDFFDYPDCTACRGPSNKIVRFDVPKVVYFPGRQIHVLVRAIRFSASRDWIHIWDPRVSEWPPSPLQVGGGGGCHWWTLVLRRRWELQLRSLGSERNNRAWAWGLTRILVVGSLLNQCPVSPDSCLPWGFSFLLIMTKIELCQCVNLAHARYRFDGGPNLTKTENAFQNEWYVDLSLKVGKKRISGSQRWLSVCNWVRPGRILVVLL